MILPCYVRHSPELKIDVSGLFQLYFVYFVENIRHCDILPVIKTECNLARSLVSRKSFEVAVECSHYRWVVKFYRSCLSNRCLKVFSFPLGLKFRPAHWVAWNRSFSHWTLAFATLLVFDHAIDQANSSTSKIFPFKFVVTFLRIRIVLTKWFQKQLPLLASSLVASLDWFGLGFSSETSPARKSKRTVRMMKRRLHWEKELDILLQLNKHRSW